MKVKGSPAQIVGADAGAETAEGSSEAHVELNRFSLTPYFCYLVLVSVISMLRLSDVIHATNRAFAGLIAAAVVAVHRADVRRSELLTLSVRSNGRGFGSSVGGRSGITASSEGEGERQDQQQGGQ